MDRRASSPVGSAKLGSLPEFKGRVAPNAFPATAPTSPSFRYSAVNSASLHPDSSETTRHKNRPPTCSVVSSQAGNGLPERNTAETDASSTVREVRYSATIPTFNRFFVVPAMASQASANFLIACGADTPVHEKAQHHQPAPSVAH